MLIRKNNAVANYNPFHEIENLERSIWGDPFSYRFDSASGVFRTDITDEGDRFLMKTDLPGFSKEDIHLDIDGDYMTLTAERHSEHEDNDKQGKFIRCERSYGNYSRSFELSGIDIENIKAKYSDGVLTLELPKRAKKEPETKRLTIE